MQRWVRLMLFFDKYWGCHQMAERSFFFHSYQFPVCARCTGVIIGYLAAIVFWFMWVPGWYIVLLMMPLVADGVTQYLGWRTSNNILRLITGILFGYSLLTTLLLAISFIISLIV